MVKAPEERLGLFTGNLLDSEEWRSLAAMRSRLLLSLEGSAVAKSLRLVHSQKRVMKLQQVGKNLRTIPLCDV